jgi:hypothetical protein
MLPGAVTGADFGAIGYVHDADGNYYRLSVSVDVVRREVVQLTLTARATEEALPKA